MQVSKSKELGEIVAAFFYRPDVLLITQPMSASQIYKKTTEIKHVSKQAWTTSILVTRKSLMHCTWNDTLEQKLSSKKVPGRQWSRQDRINQTLVEIWLIMHLVRKHRTQHNVITTTTLPFSGMSVISRMGPTMSGINSTLYWPSKQKTQFQESNNSTLVNMKIIQYRK